MDSQPLRSRHLVAAVVTAGLVVLLVATLSAARKMKPGDSYSSPRRAFTVTVPTACAPFSAAFVVGESAKQGKEFYEEASFSLSDMGELYRVGMRRLTPGMREQVRALEGPLPAGALAWLGLKLHLADREKRTGEWRPASQPEVVETRHGSGVMSVNYVQGGRFLRMFTLGHKGRMVPEASPPAAVVVLIVQRGDDLLYATGQADLAEVESVEASGGLPKPDCVRREIWKMFEGLVLANQ
jgi:hypothetical protein